MASHRAQPVNISVDCGTVPLPDRGRNQVVLEFAAGNIPTRFERARPAGLGIDVERAHARPRKSLSNAPVTPSSITSMGPVTGYAATGTPQAIASRLTSPKVSVRLGNTMTSAAARWRGQIVAEFVAGKGGVRILLLQPRALRPVADHDLAAGPGHAEKGVDVLFDGDAADIGGNRARQTREDPWAAA